MKAKKKVTSKRAIWDSPKKIAAPKLLNSTDEKLTGITKKHAEFLEHCKDYGISEAFIVDRAVRLVSLDDEQQINGFKRRRERILKKGVSLHPEAIAYLFTVEGCSKNLLLYLLFFSNNTTLGTLDCNAYIKTKFKGFAKSFFWY